MATVHEINHCEPTICYRYPRGDWNTTCLKLHRDPPSMKALKKRIKFPRGSIHEDLKMRTFYSLQCLFLAPLFLFDDGSGVTPNDLSNSFKGKAPPDGS